MNVSRSIFAVMAKSAVVALAISSASFASSWNVTEGFHHWQNPTATKSTISLNPGDLVALNDSIAGFKSPYVDSRGQVYFTKPSTVYSAGGSRSAPGVQFVSVFGGILQSVTDTTTCVVQDDGKHVALTCTEFRIQTGIAATDSALKDVHVSFQLYSSSDTVQLNYIIERQNSSMETGINVGDSAFLWNGTQNVAISPVDSLLAIPLHGQKLVLMANGVINDQFDDWQGDFNSEKAFSSKSGPTDERKTYRFVSNNGATTEGYIWNSKKSDYVWREFDQFVVKYAIHGGDDRIPDWRVWFFNDDSSKSGGEYNIFALPVDSNHSARSIVSFGTHPEDIYAGAKNWKELPVNYLKVMCYGCVGDTFDIDSVYLTRAQPSSFIFVKDTTSKDTTPVVTTHSVYVQVLGTEGSGVTVTLTGSSEKRDSLTDSSGMTVFSNVPQGSYRLDFLKTNDKVEPSYRTFQLTSNDTIIVQIYRGAPTVKTTRIYGQEDSVRTFDLDTMGWVSDPLAKAWQMSWSLKALDGNTSIPLKLNASSRTLVLGSTGSTATGTVRYLLTATNPYGASGSDTLVAEVGAVDQAPEIQSINWSLPVNGVLSVALDSVYKGQGVWAIDPDNAASSLSWSADIDKTSKNAATVSVVSNRLKLVPAVNSTDPILLNLIVRDPLGYADTAQILVPVYARPAQLYAISLQQLQPTGNLDVEVSSQYTLEPIALRNNTVQVYAPSLSLWGSVPASISVLQMPTYRSGAWIDGRYSISVQRNALLKIGKGSYRLDSLLRGRNTINMLVPWAVGGDTGSFTVSAVVRFAGPLGTLNGSYLYASADTLKRSPKLALAWTWSPLPTTQTIVVKDPAGNVVDSAVLSRAESGRQISGLKDSTSYTTLLLGTDSLGNTSSVSESDTSPSGLYALTVNLNDAALSQVSGQLCLRSSSGSRTCQDLSSANAGKYVFSHLHVGRQLLTVADNHYVGVGDSLAIQIGHADTSVAWTLVRSHFLEDGALRSWERLGSGDLRFSVTPTKPLDGELPSKISLAWVAPSGTTSASPALFAISNATSDVVDGITTWNFVLSDSLIKNRILLRDPTFGAKIRFTQIQIFTSLPNDASSDTRSDTISFPKASGGIVLWLNHEFDSLPAPQPRDWIIGRDGYSQLDYGKIDTRHGARVLESLCLLNQNGDPESCDTSSDGALTMDDAYPMSVGTPFRLTGRALFPLATDVQPLVSGSDKSGEFLQAPWGSLQAGAQWRVYSDADMTANVWVLASKSTIASLPKLYLMQDSGRSEIGSTSLWTTASNWRSVGAVRLTKGWNTLPILADSGIQIRAISLRKDGKDESASFSTLPAVPDTVSAAFNDSLKPDRTYRLKLQQVDAYGNRSPVSDTTFLVEPSGYFSDMSVEQQANGDLVLYSKGTSVANHPGMRVRLAAGAATSPIFFDATTDSGVAIRVLRDSLPSQLFGSTGTESSPTLGPITLVWDSGFQVTHRYWSWRCWCHCSSTKTLSERDSVVLQWPGLSPWKSVHDYRAIPRPTVTVVDTGSDSIALRLSGLNPTDSAGTRGQYRGSLHVEWMPGSNCNASSARDLDFGNVFGPDAQGRIAFRPSYAAAWDSKVGAWADTIESRAARRQWLDRPDGGGFYPYTRWSTERGDSSQPWIDFKVKSLSTSDVVYSLWVLPGTGNTDSSRSFYWSMNGTESSLLNEGVAEYLSSGAWVRQSAPVILHSGLNTLRIAMHQDGFSLKGILLQPASALAPDTSFHGDSLSRFGFSGYDSILVQAGGLASGVSHTFKIAAQDRVGNRSDTLTVVETTPTTKTQIAALRLLPSPWDNTGWVNSALSIGIAKDSSLLTGTLPQTVRGLLLKVDRFKAAPDTQAILTASSLSDTTWNMPIAGLPSWPSNQTEFSAGSRYQLVVWGEVNGEKGPSVTLGFGVRAGSTPGQLSGNLPDYQSQGVLFHPLVTWADGANIFSNLELKNFARKEGDSVHYHLVLRGAQVSLDTSTSNWSITNLSGGLFQSQRCVLSGSDSTCTESSAMPWSLGPWTGEIPVSGMAFTMAKGFQVESAHLMDDKKRLVRSQPAFLIDGGIRDTLSVLKDRFWFRNVVAHDTGDAFSIEGCRTSMTQAGGALHMIAAGCTDNAGPFLVFDVVLETAGPDSWMGSAYDSLPLPYHLDWASGTGYLAKDSAVVTRTSLRNFSGASLWGYDVHAYKFDSSGVVLRDFDLLLPQGKVFPGDSSGDSTTRQKISGFSGAHIASVNGTMSGMPVLLGSAQSSSKKSITFDSLDVLSGHSGWDYSSYVGYGFALTPQNANNAMTMNIPQPAGNFRYSKINGQAQDTDTIRMPISSLVFGPGEYAFVADTQSFEARAGGISLSGTLILSFLDQDLSVTTTGVSATLDSFFTEASSNFPGNFSSQTVSDVSLGLSEWFGLQSVQASGAVSANNALLPPVYVAGLPWIPFQASAYQLMRGNNDIYVRLLKPSVKLQFWPSTTSLQSSDPSTWVYAAIFNSHRMPVAVASRVAVPENWNKLSLPGFESFGSVLLERLDFEAGIESDTAYARVSGPATIEFGTLFDKIGIAGWRLPLTNVGFELSKNVSSNALNVPIARLTALQTGSLGIPLSLSLTKKRIRKWFSDEDADGSSNPEYVHLYTGGNSISAHLLSQDAIDVGIGNWNLQLTDSFPVSAMRGLNFHLDTLGVRYSKGSLSFTAFGGSGSKQFDSLEILPGFVLLPKKNEKVAVSLENDSTTQSKETIAALAVAMDSIRLGSKVYSVGCGNSAKIKFRLDGKLEGSVCVTEKDDISIYPIGSTSDRKVWIANGGASGPWLTLNLSFDGSKLSVSVNDANIKSSDLPVVGALDLKAGVKFTVSSSGLELDSISVIDSVKKSTSYGPFKLGIATIGLRAWDTAVSAGSTQKWFGISATPTFGFSTGTCTSDASGTANFSSPINKSPTTWKLDWSFAANMNCTVASLSAEARGIRVSNEGNGVSVGVDTLRVSLDKVKDYIPSASNEMGLRVIGLSYANDLSVTRVEPIGLDSIDQLHLEIPYVGVEVWSKLNILPLFDLHKPGIAFDDIRVKLPSTLGGETYPTNFAVRLDGEEPYIHARGNLKGLHIPVPSIELTPAIKFQGAKLNLRFVEGDSVSGTKDSWVFEGSAGLGIPGFISGIDVAMALKKPNPNDCRTGICKAALTLEMKSSPVPLGTTGLYMAGLKGAFYDGSYVPECAQDCGIMSLPNGMKFEFAILLQAQNPNVLNGMTGFWMQLNKLNFGIDGQFNLLEGNAVASACAAIYNNGNAFHGQFETELQTSLWVKGGFYIDIWADDHGKNMAAEADASVGLNRGAIIHCRWFKYPRHRSLFGPFVTRFGRFKNGSNGFTTGVRLLGRTWGLGYVDGSFRLGDIGRYKLATPSGSSLTPLSTSDYAILPLGVDLQGDELITAMVASAEGTDWGGQQLHLVNSSNVTKNGFGKIGSIVLDGTLDSTDVEREDSLNFHRLTWSNYNHTGRVYFIAPLKAGTSGTSSEVATSDSISKSWGDEQFIIGLVPPSTENLTARTCSDSTICISGTIQHFHATPRTIQRSLNSTEKTLNQNVVDTTSQTLLSQKNRLNFYVMRKELKQGSIQSDSGAAMEIPLEEFTGQPAGALSLVGNACAVADTASGTLTLNNCQWSHAAWSSGTYRLQASLEAVNLLQDGKVISEDSSTDVVELSRVDLTPSDSFFVWKNSRPLLPVQALTVYTSALDSTMHPGADERRRVSLRWKTHANPDLGGYAIRWIFEKPQGHFDSTDFQVGATDHWSIDVPDTALKSAQRYDTASTNAEAAILDTATNPTWFFSPPKTLRVLPYTLSDDDSVTTLVKRNDLAVSWSGDLLLGTPGADDTTNRLTMVRKDNSDTARRIPRGSTDNVTLLVAHGAFQSDTTALRPATDYASLELQWLDSSRKAIGDTAKFLPSVGGNVLAWHVSQATDTLALAISPLSRDVPCASILGDSLLDSAKKPVKDTTFRSCTEGEFLQRATPFGLYYLQVTGWNEGRRAAGAAAKLEIPVQVTLPKPSIDVVETPYLLNGITQDLTFRATRLWGQDGMRPIVRLKAMDGTLLDTLQVPGVDTTSVFDSSLVLNWLGKTIATTMLGSDTAQIQITLVNRGSSESVESNPKMIEYVLTPDNIACQEKYLNTNDVHYEWAMDFNGFYPKSLHAGDSVLALFSEIHNSNYRQFQVLVSQGNDTNSVSFNATPWGVYFKLPTTLDTTKLVDLLVRIPYEDSNAAKHCRGQSWSSTFKLLSSRTGAGSRYRIEVASGRFRVHGLTSDESMVWNLGVPDSYNPVSPVQGDTNWISVAKTDYIHMRITNKVSQIVDTVFLVEAPVALSVRTSAGRSLAARDSLLSGTRLYVSSAPSPVLSKAGASSLSLQCRWNDAAWAACPDAGWTVGASISGMLHVRPVWGLHGRTDTTLYGGEQLWNVSLRGASGYGWSSSTLSIPGSRLRRLLDSTEAGAVVTLRRQGAQLARWSVQAPVVRDAQGAVLSQQVLNYDSAGKNFVCRVRIPSLIPGTDLPVQLWAGDTTDRPSPTIAGEVFSVLPKDTLALPGTDGNGYSMGYWFHWHGRADTLFRNNDHILVTDSQGTLTWNWGSDTVRSVAQALDTAVDHLLGLTWSSRSGEGILSLDGRPVGAGSLHVGTHSGMPANTVRIASGAWWFDWKPVPETPQGLRLRWESERSHGALWNPDSTVAGTRPVVQGLSGAALDTVGLSQGAHLWGDREDSVVTFPTALAGALLVQGQAARRADTSNYGGYWQSAQSAEVCLVQDSGWTGLTGWTRSTAWNVNGLALWCRVSAAGDVFTPGPRHDGASGNLQGNAWILRLLPGRSSSQTSFQVGDTADGWILQKVPTVLDSAVLLKSTTLASGAKTVNLSGPGLVWIALPTGSLMDSLLSHGWASSGISMVAVNASTGQSVTLHLLYPTSSAVLGALTWSSSADPVLVFVASGTSTAVVKTSATVRTDTIRSGSGSKIILSSGDTISVSSLPGTTVIETPRDCQTHSWEVTLGRASTQWLAIAPEAGVSSIEGWTASGTVQTSDGEWPVWSRVLAAGVHTTDLTQILDPNTCAKLFSWFQDIVDTPPSWLLGEVRVHALGGGRKAVGGLHMVQNLDLEPAAALDVHSDQHQLRLTSSSGWGEQLGSAVLGLGDTKVVETVDSSSGSSAAVVISKHWTLSDLRADLLDADSVTVDAVTLATQGVVRLTIKNHGATPFTTGLSAVLFRDANGNYQYDAGTDTSLGVQTLPRLEAGQSAVLEFPVSGTVRRFPEELFFAWIDGGAYAPEFHAGDHVAIGPSPCRRRLKTTWTSAADSLTAPTVATGVFPGLSQALGVRLWDSNGDSIIDGRDSAQLLWVGSGRLWLARQGGDTLWSASTSVASLSDISVRDVQGDGIPEIVAGNEIWSRTGRRLWDGSSASSQALDLADEGLVDSIAVKSSCVEVWSGQRELLWSSSSCAKQGAVSSLAAISRLSSGCSDISVSAPKALLAGNGFSLRIANAGTVDVPAGIPIHLAQAGVLRATSATTRILRPGEWEDVSFLMSQVPTGTQWKAWSETSEAAQLGILDSHPLNNAVQWGN